MNKLITIFFIILAIIIIIFMLWVNFKPLIVRGDEYSTTTAKVIDIRFDDSNKTISTSFEMSATVKPNNCNACLKERQPSECLVICEQNGSVMYN